MKGSCHHHPLLTDIHIGQWRDGGDEYDGCLIRNLDYVLNLNNPLGPKTSKVDEVQVSL